MTVPADLTTLAADVDQPDHAAEEAARAALADRLARRGPALLGAGTSPRSPQGDRLAAVAVWLAATRGSWPPPPPRDPVLLLVAADRGDDGLALSSGPALPGQLAALADGSSALGGVLADGTVGHRVEEVTHASALGPVDLDAVLVAVGRGRALVDAEVDAGRDLVLLGHLGPGATAAAAAVVCLLTDAEPATLTGRGASGRLDDDAWGRKTVAVRDAVRRARPYAREPADLLAELGALDLAVMVGVLLGAAARRTPVVLDGAVAATAALTARQVAPLATAWWQVAQRCPDPTFERAVRVCALDPLLDLGSPAGDGTSALLTLPLLRAACQGLGA